MCDTMMWLTPKEPTDEVWLGSQIEALNKQYRMDASVLVQPTVRLGGYDQTVIPGYTLVYMSHAGGGCLCTIRDLAARGVLKLALLLEEVAPSWVWKDMGHHGNTVPTSGGTTNEALIEELRKIGGDLDVDPLRAELALTRAILAEKQAAEKQSRAQHYLVQARKVVVERGKALAELTGSTDFPMFAEPCEHEFDFDDLQDAYAGEGEVPTKWAFCKHCQEAATVCTKCGAIWTECRSCNTIRYLDGTVAEKHECPA